MECQTPTIYGDLHTRTASHTWSPAGASKECATAVETKHTTLARCLEPDQDGDTEGINMGDEAVDNNATELSNNVVYATTVEALQITQQKVQDDTRHQHFSQGKLSTPGTMDAASYSPRSALELPKTPRLSLLSPISNPDDTKRVVTKSAHTSKTNQGFANGIESQELPLDGDISPEKDIKKLNSQIFSSADTQTRPMTPQQTPSLARLPPSTSTQLKGTPDPSQAGYHETTCYYTLRELDLLTQTSAKTAPRCEESH